MLELSSFMESVGCSLVFTDETQRVVDVNEYACLLFGISKEHLVGRRWDELIQLTDTLRASMANSCCQVTSPVEVAICCANGLHPARHSSSPWRSREFAGTLHTLKDLKPQQVARREAREIVDNYLQILAKTPAVVYVKNTDWRYEYVNQRYLDLFHLTPEAVIGKTDFDLFPPSVARAFRKNDMAVLESGQPIQLDEVAPHDDGPHEYVSIKFPLHDCQGRVRAVAGISTDVTESRKGKRLEREVQAAALIQDQLYPHLVPNFPGYEMAGMARPAHIASGDYYDLIPHGPGKMCVVIGDVSGHGLASALIMVETRAILRACLEDHLSLTVVAERLNRFLVKDTPEQQFLTFFLGEIDSNNHTLTYVAAGHPAWLVNSQGQPTPLKAMNIPLGLIDSIELQSARTKFLPGDMLFVVTDGVAEAHSECKEFFGSNRTLQIICDHREEPADQILARLLREVESFRDSQSPAQELTTSASQTKRHLEFDDDLTAVLVKCLRDS